MRILSYVLLSTLLVSALPLFADDDFGVVRLGAGRTGIGYPQDATTIFQNPGGIYSIQTNWMNAGYGKLFSGISGGVNEGYFSITRMFEDIGAVGFGWGTISDNIYSKNLLLLGFSRRFLQGKETSLDIGASLRLYANSYNRKNFRLDEPDPLLDRKNSKLAPSFDIGLVLQQGDFIFGISGRNLVEPDLSLGAVPEGKERRAFGLGVSFVRYPYLLPALDIMQIPDNRYGRETQVRIGLRSHLLKNRLLLSAGYNIDEVSLGGAFVAFPGYGLGIEYSLVFPTEPSAFAVSGGSHRFGLFIQGRRLVKRELDVAAMFLTANELFRGETGKVTGIVKNTGEKRASEFFVSLYYCGGDGSYRPIFPKKYIESLPPDSEAVLDWDWTPGSVGEFELVLSVDDDGTSFPDVVGRIKETDEKNNVLSIEVQVVPSFEIKLLPHQMVLPLEEVTTCVEEEPIIPVVFFEKNSSVVDTVYHRLLKTIAERLSANPGVSLVLSGFVYDDEPDTALSLRRAEAVRDYILSLDPSLEGRVLARMPDDVHRKRVPPETEIARLFIDMVEAENRRVEMEAVVSDTMFKKLFEIQFNLGSSDVDTNPLDSFDITGLQIFLEKNPDVLLFIEGFRDSSEDEGLPLRRAKNVRLFFRGYLPQKLARILDGGVGLSCVRGYLSAEGVIFRPRAGMPFVKEYLPNRGFIDTIDVVPTADIGKLDSYELTIEDAYGNVVRRLASGKGELPGQFFWNWEYEGDFLVLPDERYYCVLRVVSSGREKKFRSKPLRAEVSLRRREIESIILVEYIFNEIVPSSSFLESREEDVVRRLEAFKGDRLRVVIAGHTDRIGTEEYNITLSRRRAEREVERIKALLKDKWGDDFEQKLKEKNITIEPVGYGYSRPYSVEILTPDGIKELLVGDNETPYGRTANRRVVAEFYYQRTFEK